MVWVLIHYLRHGVPDDPTLDDKQFE